MSLSEHQSQLLPLTNSRIDASTSTSTTMTTSANALQQQKIKQSREAMKDIIFGSVAGSCAKFFEYPFDTVKVRLQSQGSAAASFSTTSHGQAAVAGIATGGTGINYTGPLDCFRKSLASGGIRSLYRGISAPIFGAAVETSSLFFSYRIAQEALVAIAYPQDPADRSTGKIHLPFGALLVCGAASGAFTSLLLTPIELVKCQMQAEPGPSAAAGNGGSARAGGGTTYKNPLAVIRTVWKHNGVRGFWRGQMGTLIRETGGSAAWFGSYEGVSALLARRSSKNSSASITTAGTDDLQPAPVVKTPVWHQLFAGACAGVAYNFLFYPADTIKSRMQTEQVDISGSASKSARGLITRRSTFFSVGRKLWLEHGMSGMYRGCGITVARSAPASAMIFAIFEFLRANFA